MIAVATVDGKWLGLVHEVLCEEPPIVIDSSSLYDPVEVRESVKKRQPPKLVGTFAHRLVEPGKYWLDIDGVGKWKVYIVEITESECWFEFALQFKRPVFENSSDDAKTLWETIESFFSIYLSRNL